ncbi:MAG: TIGR04282 family arsenosugar biosynthesis glycosyltransferase [Rhodothermales bacterium]
MNDAALIVFAKPPVPGGVKTRLTPFLTEREAADVYAAFLGDAVEQYTGLTADVRLYLAAPSSAADDDASGAAPSDAAPSDGALDAGIADLFQQMKTFTQRGAMLGERMLRAFAETFSAGYGRVVIVGTDHPTMPSSFLEKAIEHLATPRTVVVGPAEDGGYYLLGMNDLRPEVFHEMSYSHDAVFDETVRRVAEGGAGLTVLPTWYDVDTPADLVRLAEEVDEVEGGLRRTRAVLARLRDRYPEIASPAT